MASDTIVPRDKHLRESQETNVPIDKPPKRQLSHEQTIQLSNDPEEKCPKRQMSSQKVLQ